MASIDIQPKQALKGLGLAALALPLASCATKTVSDVVPATKGTKTGQTLVDYGTSVHTSTLLTFETSRDDCKQCPTDLQNRGRYVEKQMVVDTDRSSTQSRVEGGLTATGVFLGGAGQAAVGVKYKPTRIGVSATGGAGGNASATGGSATSSSASSATSSSSSSAAATAVGTGG